MALRIDPDHRRFRDIVRGKIKQDLRKYISQGELIGRKGKDLVSIPLPQINVPRFRFGSKDKGGVGQGDGEVSDSLGKGDPAGRECHSRHDQFPPSAVAALPGSSRSASSSESCATSRKVAAIFSTRVRCASSPSARIRTTPS